MATPHGGATYGNTSLADQARAHLGNNVANGATGNVGYHGTAANHQARLFQGQYVSHGSNDTVTGNTVNYHIYGNYTSIGSNTQLPFRPNSTSNSAAKVSPFPRYQQGTLAAGHVRLFALHCTQSEPEILEISLFCVRVEELSKYKYTALSFSWSAAGARQVPLHVRIPTSAAQPETTFQALHVPSNLDLALGRIRSRHVSSDPLTSSPFVVYIWANSICVDWAKPADVRQHNNYTHDIFRFGYRQIVWLGPGDERSIRAMKFAAEAATSLHFKSLIADDSGLEKCKALMKLLQNPLFEHRTLMTELASSYQIMLVNGEQQLEWQPFTLAVEQLLRNFDAIQFEARHSRTYSEDTFAGDLESLPVVTLIRKIANVSRRSGPKGSWEPLMSLEQLFSIFSNCYRFRDSPVRVSVRSFMPIAKRESRIVIPESAPADEILYRVAASIIRRTRSLDLLCQPWAPHDYVSEWPTSGARNTVKPLASWIRHCSGSAYPIDSLKMMQRINGDPFVSVGHGHSIYAASNGRRARYCFATWFDDQEKQFSDLESRDSQLKPRGGLSSSLSNTVGTRHITVDGLQIGTVTSVSEPIAEGVIPSHILKILGWDPQNSSVMPDKLLRSLVADRGPGGSSIPAPYATACKLAFDQISVNGHLNTTRLLEHTDNENLRSFLRRVQAVVWNRRFFEVSIIDKRPKLPGSGGKLHGWGPLDAYRGQGELIICVLFGCSVPCILRKLPHDEYQFVGETNVYGLMDGEAVSSLSEEEIEGKKVGWTIV